MTALSRFPVVAHAIGGAEFNLPLVLTGVALVALAVWLKTTKKGASWLVPLTLAVGLGFGGLSFLVPDTQDDHVATSAVVTILEPESGAAVPANEPVTIRVAVQNGTVATDPADTEGGHLHLYMDGELQQMPYATEAELEMPPGEHELRVEFVDNRHVSFDPAVEHTVVVTAA